MNYDQHLNPSRRSVWRRVFLNAVAVLVFFSSVVALLLGTVATLCAFFPGTDIGDAKVFIRTGPLLRPGRYRRLVADSLDSTDPLEQLS